MSNEISKCFLVQFTKHVTYEMEPQATSEKDALELACQMLAGMKQTGFAPVETDHTDLTAIPLEPAALNLPSKVPAAMASSSRVVSSARPVTSSDVAIIVKLLEEVRDTTLSHGSWDDAKRLIRQFTE